MNSPILPHIVEQHAEEAAFLWCLRDAAISAPHYDLSDLAALDNRVDAHLDGLAVAAEPGLSIAMSYLEGGGPGEVFAAAAAAIGAANSQALARVVEYAQSAPDLTRALHAALGWAEKSLVEPMCDVGFRHSSSHRQLMSTCIVAMHRLRSYGDKLQLDSDDPQLIDRSIRAVGELKAGSYRNQLKPFLESERLSHRFWSTWSLTLLGDPHASQKIKPFVEFKTPYAQVALQIACRAMRPSDSTDWLRLLAQDVSTRRLALSGTGYIGDPVFIPTLINQMSNPEYARVAGEAFSMITGVDLAYEDLDGDSPDDEDFGPTDDPDDENVEMDPDEDLPWPNQELVQQWWQNHGGQFNAGYRYLCGNPVTEEGCQRVLREGYQRQRLAAAYELALMEPDRQLFEWRAPGFRQQRQLAS